MENQSSNSNMADHPWSLLKQEDYYFAGRSGPDEYFEWEHKMNEFFISCRCPDFEKVYIAADQLIDLAQLWWRQSTAKGGRRWNSREYTWENEHDHDVALSAGHAEQTFHFYSPGTQTYVLVAGRA
ncbi:hypothetical protein Rs2_35661 [Raphanus sativus]|nr:hypothetical protein Rs2_35661 [Raphanus sativus]